MLRCEDKSVSMLYPKKARQDAELLFELTSVDKHEMLCLLIRTWEIAVLLESITLWCEDNSVSMSYQQKL